MMPLLLLSVEETEAALVARTLCGELSVNHTDVNSNNSLLADDYFLNNNDKPARGATLRVHNNDTNTTVDWTLSNADPACVTISMEDTDTYNLKLLAKATIGGNFLQVRNDDTNNAIWSYQGPTNYDPSSGNPSPLDTGTHAAWNILSAASWALDRRNAGLSGETFIYYTQTCPGSASGTSCLYPSNDRLYIDPAADELKYVVAHETGHLVTLLVNGGAYSNRAVLASPDGNCQASDGPMIVKHYTSLAADEGLAWYYAAVAFNSTATTDCDFYRGGHDWDQDGTPGEDGTGGSEDELTPSCQGVIGEGWAAFDYIDNECGGTLEDRGVYIDWMRAFWDLDAIYGVSTTDIFTQLWVDAIPATWDDNGGGGSNDVEERFDTAASGMGISTEWGIVAAINGVH